MPQIVIDENISIEAIAEHHAPLLFEYVDRERETLATWLAWPNYLNSIEDELAFIEQCQQQAAKGISRVYSIQFNGEPVGTAGFIDIQYDLEKGEIGYWLSRRVHGKGIMTKVCQQLFLIGFSELGLTKITASVAVGNDASNAVCERLGMVLEGTLSHDERINGQLLTHHKYAKFKGAKR